MKRSSLLLLGASWSVLVWGSFAASAAEVQPVTLLTLSGEVHEGTLTGLDDGVAKVATDDDGVEVPTEEILKIEVGGEPIAPPEGAVIQIGLQNGSKLRAMAIQSENQKVSATLQQEMVLPLAMTDLANVQFLAAEGDQIDRWAELRTRESTRDALVVSRSKGVLDFIEGTIGEIGPEKVKFLLNGNEIAIPRTRLFGLLFATRKVTEIPLCQVTLIGEQRLDVESVSLSEQGVAVTVSSGGTMTLPAEWVRSLDFSQTKVQYLSALEPRTVKDRFVWNEPSSRWLFEYRRDRNQDGLPLRIRDRTFRRGLWIHSETTLTYRLNGDYRTFSAIAGIEELGRDGHGDVLLKITADDKVLFEKRVTWKDDPIPLEFSVAGVRDLVIHVGFGEKLDDVSDHLALGDAKLVR